MKSINRIFDYISRHKKNWEFPDYFTEKQPHRRLEFGCTIIQIWLSQHMPKLDLSLGAKMQMAILQWQPHCINESHVPEFYPFLGFPYDLSVLS